MQPLFLLFASILSVQAALQVPSPSADPGPILSQRNDCSVTVTVTATPDPRSVISAYMATQTNSELAAAYASVQANRQNGTSSGDAKNEDSISYKMKSFFENLKVKGKKKKDESSTNADAQPSAAA